MLKKLTSIFILTLLFSSASQAAVNCGNNTVFCAGPASELISGLFPFDNNGTAVILIESNPTVNNLPCSGAVGGPNVLLSSNSLVFKEAYATLLTAVATDKEVTLRIDDNESDCTLLYVRLKN